MKNNSKFSIIFIGLILLNSCDSKFLEQAFAPKIEIKENSGNGDNTPNKGEDLTLNVSINGISKENSTVSLSTTSSFMKIVDDTSSNREQLTFRVNIDKSTPDGTEIPLFFKYKNVLDLDSTANSIIKIVPIDNKISFQRLDVKENSGNGDNIPNKGEDISFSTTFVNTGGVSSNPLTISLSTTSSFAKIIDDSTSIEALKPNAPKETNSYNNFRLVLDKTVTANTEIPLTFKLKDTFGNEFITNTSLKTNEINNKISFQSLNIKENSGNGDNVPNRGEDIDISVIFVNTGGVSSNPLTILLSTTSSFAKIIDDSTSIEALKPNAPKETNSYNNFRLVLDRTVTANTEIPLTFKLKDNFGNEYTTTGSFIVR